MSTPQNLSSPGFPRRRFLQILSAAGAVGLSRAIAAQPSPNRYRAAIIGHTGRGDYGHGLDLIFDDHPKIELLALADPDEAGGKKAASKAKAPRDYADYHTLLEREKPHLVCVAPRWTDLHFAMIRAALESGAHVLSEKPFTQTLTEADELLKLAGKHGLKICRRSPNAAGAFDGASQIGFGERDHR